jgi:hypothetical protein
MDQPNTESTDTAGTKAPKRTKARSINPNAFSYTLTDAGDMSGLSVATLRRREKEGALAFARVGGRTLVNGDSLRRLVGAES